MDRHYPRKIGIGLDRTCIRSLDARTKEHTILRTVTSSTQPIFSHRNLYIPLERGGGGAVLRGSIPYRGQIAADRRREIVILFLLGVFVVQEAETAQTGASAILASFSAAGLCVRSRQTRAFKLDNVVPIVVTASACLETSSHPLEAIG